jgi:hypothetical protein
MQKVGGSSPISRLGEALQIAGFFLLLELNETSVRPVYWCPNGPPLRANFADRRERQS